MHRLAFLGDLMLGRDVGAALPEHGPGWIWGDVRPLLTRTDAVIANLESPITDETRPGPGWKYFRYRAPSISVPVLQAGNVRLLCLANNHILDYGPQGLHDTRDHLRAAGIGFAGAGPNAGDAAAPTLLDANGLRLGFLAATDGMPAFAAGPAQAGSNYVVFDATPRALDPLRAALATLRAQGAELVVLSLHWGPNLPLSPKQRFRAYAHAAIEAGVGIVHGHSAHLSQGIEVYRGGLILYGTGGFIDDYWRIPFYRTRWSSVSVVEIEDARPVRLRVFPVRQHSIPVTIAAGAEGDAILRRLQVMSEAFGTNAALQDGSMTVSLRDGAASAGIAAGSSRRAATILPTSELLADILAQMPHDTVNITWFMQRLGERSFGLVLLLLGLLGVVPGISGLVGVLVAMTALQMLLARSEPVFPRFVAMRSFSSRKLSTQLRRAIPAARRLERLIVPRWHTPFEATKRVVGLIVLLLGLLLLTPVPFSNVAPSLAILLIAFAYLEHDGLLLAGSLTIALGAIVAAIIVIWRMARIVY
jgi:poly-gamma-glutamate capsule biosynthesis protein CapA/YwtB (metallophosphatase superfamily)